MSCALHNTLRDLTLFKAEKDGHGVRESALPDLIVMTHQRRIAMTLKNTSDAYEGAASNLEAAAEHMNKALTSLLDTEKATSERVKAAVSRAKNGANQLGDALARVNKVLGSDFERKIDQLERVATALATLAELDKAGKLSGVLAALKAQ